MPPQHVRSITVPWVERSSDQHEARTPSVRAQIVRRPPPGHKKFASARNGISIARPPHSTLVGVVHDGTKNPKPRIDDGVAWMSKVRYDQYMKRPRAAA